MEILLLLILIVLSIIALLSGFFSGDISDFIAAGVLAVFIRIVQSNSQHKEIKRLLGEEPPERPPERPSESPPSLHELGRMKKDKDA